MQLVLDSSVPQQEREKASRGSLPDGDAASAVLEAHSFRLRSAERLGRPDDIRQRSVDFEPRIGTTWLTRGAGTPAARLNRSQPGRMHRMQFAGRPNATDVARGLRQTCASSSRMSCNSPAPAMSGQPSTTAFPVVRRRNDRR